MTASTVTPRTVTCLYGVVMVLLRKYPASTECTSTRGQVNAPRRITEKPAYTKGLIDCLNPSASMLFFNYFAAVAVAAAHKTPMLH